MVAAMPGPMRGGELQQERLIVQIGQRCLSDAVFNASFFATTNTCKCLFFSTPATEPCPRRLGTCRNAQRALTPLRQDPWKSRVQPG